jgi:hypothetical protein
MGRTWLGPHQSRLSEPTVYEDLLGDALEDAYRNGVAELEGIALRLNAECVPSPNGVPWTAALLEAELKRLGE